MEELEQYRCTLYETRDQLKRHVFDRADAAFRAGDEARDRIASRQQLAERQQAMKQALLEAVGGLPESAGEAPLHAAVVGVARGEGYTVEKIVYEARPKHYVTGNLYMPEAVAASAAPAPAVLFLSGHEREAKHNPYYHEVCLRMVQAGLIVLAIDPVGQGERLTLLPSADGQPIWGTAEHQRLGVQAYALGQSVARYFIHDAMRAIDYLETRPEVDSSRIGVTGNSGGGTQTAMMMVCDDRIAAAAPATFIMNRQQYMHAGGVQDAEQIWPGLTALGFDHEDLLLAFAPKPLLVCAVEYDFFPIEATRRTVERTRRFWEMHGRGELHQMVEDASTHRYTDRLAMAAADFFARHLAGHGEAQRAACRDRAARGRLAPLAPEQLRCTASGQVQLEYADARSVADACRQAAALLAQEREAAAGPELPQRWLTRKVLHARRPCALNPRIVRLAPCDGLDVRYAMWWSQEGIMNSGYLFQSADGTLDRNSGAQVTIAIWPGGTMQLAARWPWIRSVCAAGRTVLVLNMSGVGPHEPNPLHGKPQHRFFGMLHKLADELIWLDDSLAAMRIYDVMRSMDFIHSLYEDKRLRQPPEMTLYAEGLFRVYAELASAIDKRIARLEDHSGETCIKLSDWLAQGIVDDTDVMSITMPGLLRYYDPPVSVADMQKG